MRVLVFEQFYSGHYFTYIEHLLPRLSDLVSEVVVAITKPAIESEHFKVTLGKHRALRNVQFEGCVPPADGSLPTRERFALLRNLRDAISHTKPDYVLVPSADGPTLAMGILGHAGITLLPKGIPSEATLHYGYGPAVVTARHFLKETAYRMAYSGCSWTHLNFVNFLFFEYAIAHRWRWTKRVRLVPDPVPKAPRLTKTEARKLLNVPQEGRYVGFLGLLDPRKAVPELLAAFRAAKLGESDRLLLAGQMDPAFRALIADDYNDLLKNERLIVIDRHLTEAELIQGYGALDLVCVANRPPGLSSLMLKGVAAGRPIISHDFGWSSALVRRFDLGKVADVFDTEKFAQTLRNAVDASADYRESEATRRLLAFHDISNFTETMLDNVRSAVGKPQEQPLRVWDWVLQALEPEYHNVLTENS
jgi:glycosyltransferase involved in cell wall biosynthesis